MKDVADVEANVNLDGRQVCAAEVALFCRNDEDKIVGTKPTSPPPPVGINDDVSAIPDEEKAGMEGEMPDNISGAATI